MRISLHKLGDCCDHTSDRYNFLNWLVYYDFVLLGCIRDCSNVQIGGDASTAQNSHPVFLLRATDLFSRSHIRERPRRIFRAIHADKMNRFVGVTVLTGITCVIVWLVIYAITKSAAWAWVGVAITYAVVLLTLSVVTSSRNGDNND